MNELESRVVSSASFESTSVSLPINHASGSTVLDLHPNFSLCFQRTMTLVPETYPVRPGHEIDLQALSSYLSVVTRNRIDRLVDIRQFQVDLVELSSYSNIPS